MKVLPPVTQPYASPLRRLHEPPQASGERGYRSYRPCLRWDFGFTCAFCLLHDRDLSKSGLVDGFALTSTEHFFLKSVAPERRNDYANCFYCCKLCNDARGEQPNEAEGARLLEPCGTTWGERFEVDASFGLRPRSDADGDARRTWMCYDLADPRKRRIKQRRHASLDRGLNALRRLAEESRWLLALIEDLEAMGLPRSGPERLRRTLDGLGEVARGVIAELRDGHSALPPDAPDPCACGVGDERALPAALLEQLLDLEEVDGAQGTAAAR